MKAQIHPVCLRGFIFLVGLFAAAFGDSLTIRSGESRSGDQYIGVESLRHEGSISGDLFVCGKNIDATGTVGGDIIGFGQDVNLLGNVGGNVRVGAKSVTLTGKVEKNVMLAGQNVTVRPEARVSGSLSLGGQNIEVGGKIAGLTRIFGEKITLAGEFFGDIEVNVIPLERKDREDWELNDVLTVMPEAIIHGKLTFQGTRADIKPGSKVGSFNWIKTEPASSKGMSKDNRRRVWDFLKFIFTTIAFFLIGLISYRWFPNQFSQMGDFAVQKPWGALLYGLVSILATLPVAVLFIALVAMYLILSPSLAIVFGSAAASIYLALYTLSIIPVGIWVGRLISRKNPNAMNRFGLGLLAVSALIYLLGFLNSLHVAGHLFGVLSFAVRFSVSMFGAGVLIHVGKEFFLAARRG